MATSDLLLTTTSTLEGKRITLRVEMEDPENEDDEG
jgi:hypothetical protein